MLMSFVNGYVNIAINCNIIATPDSAKNQMLVLTLLLTVTIYVNTHIK